MKGVVSKKVENWSDIPDHSDSMETINSDEADDGFGNASNGGVDDSAHILNQHPYPV